MLKSLLMKTNKSIYNEGFAYPFFTSFFTPFLRPRLFKTLFSIFYNFFFAQHRAAFLPGRIPVKSVDHPLDSKVPFVPRWITIYIDFVFFWTRIISFYLKRYGRKGHKTVGAFITSMGYLYEYAGEVYTKCFSTTKRPFYIARPRFFMIHMLDPHLMCIPSLHVMIAIHAYTMFEKIAKEFNDEENLKDQIIEMKQGALAITQAVLFVKQHSVNCIPAAFYAMTCYTPDLFPPQEAQKFTQRLFSPPPVLPQGEKPPGGKVYPTEAPKTILPEKDMAEIKEYIMMMYNRFLEEGKTAKSWEEPLVNFLNGLP